MNFLTWISCISDRDSVRAFQSFESYTRMNEPNAPEDLTTAYHTEIGKGWERWAIAKAMWVMMSFWMNLRFNRYTLRWSDPGLYQWLRGSDLER